MKNNKYFVEAKDVVKYFPLHFGLLKRKIANIKAVDKVSFGIKPGETLGLVGESGCGKTTTGRCILHLYDLTAGKIYFNGEDITLLEGERLRHIRRDMQLIFQDPYASLDPRMTVGDIISEPLLVHNLVKGKEHKEQAKEMMKLVELDPNMSDRYAHEFSGGQRQRIGIARALATRPKFIVCDEPVSALDVSIQAQVVMLLTRLKEELNLTYLFIAHDLSVVRYISNRVAVMYVGKIVEITDSTELYAKPLHPYTQALLSAVPIPNPEVDRQRSRILLVGDVPSPLFPPRGCRFHPRCRLATAKCQEDEPQLRDVGNEHWVACHLV
ncbi:MAG: oligopeptide/dipeptide ABC transporter ATP-binding protein [Dehalococcoidia bacterium]